MALEEFDPTVDLHAARDAHKAMARSFGWQWLIFKLMARYKLDFKWRRKSKYDRRAALGAAGGIEAIFTLLALRDQIAPATLNLDTPDPAAAGLNLVRGQAQKLAIEYAISNGFGFGGVNASVLFKRWQ